MLFNNAAPQISLHCNPFLVSYSGKFGTCTVVSVMGHKLKIKCAQFSFNRCPFYTHDGASAKFSINSQETDNSVCQRMVG
jgi:hypothetical protein